MLALKQEQLFDKIDILAIDLKTKIVDKILASITPAKNFKVSNCLAKDRWRKI
jgi:hypothetical protein